MKDKLKDLGYEEIKPNLFMMVLPTGIRLYHDYRKGKRWSYAFDGNDSVDVKEFDEYNKVKILEEGDKCKKISDFLPD